MADTRGANKRRRLPAAVYLCYLLAAVLAFTGASVAGYRTENAGENSARAAQFNIAAVGQDTTEFKLSASHLSDSYSFTVTNGSGGNVTETAVSYDVIVTVPEGQSLPNGVTISLTNGETTVSGQADTTGRVYTFPGAGVFKAASPETQNLTLTFTAVSGASSGSVSGISVDVVAAQID